MISLLTLSLTEAHNSHHKAGRFSVRFWEPRLVFLVLFIHRQVNREQANQELEAALQCVASTHQTTWSKHLPWIEYSRNSLTSLATGLSPFEASLASLSFFNFLSLCFGWTRLCLSVWLDLHHLLLELKKLYWWNLQTIFFPSSLDHWCLFFSL